jgi:alpha-L-fucosidase
LDIAFLEIVLDVIGMSNLSHFLLRIVVLLLFIKGLFSDSVLGQGASSLILVHTNLEPMAAGKFEPTWDSLKQYRCPQWFQNAKFGIWAHWGPQCEPEDGDWYARLMYIQGTPQNKFHVAHYGPPSQFGFKDVIHEWKAQNWDPDKLVKLYKNAGAQYFMALANHHDNFDNWDSKYQPWNSVKIGPQKDLIGGWAAAARKYGLYFGVSVHASHAWSWYEPAQGADQAGPLAGVPYDGKLTKADGAGKWWSGLDPQDLYAQNHKPSPGFETVTSLYDRWDWDNGVSTPDQAYCDKYYNRTMDLINKYHPDLIYFDDTALPLWPVSDAGLKLAANFYNNNIQWHGTNDDGVLFGKVLTPDQQECMVWDIERGQANEIEPYHWQTDTCLGNWHYDRAIYDRNGYKSTKMVIQMLADIVSKNGNLLLNVPVRGDGTIDDKEVKVVQGIADWMAVNRECIFGTQPWRVFGEGPASAGAKLRAQGFNEGKGKPYTAEDVRFTQKGQILYAIVLGAPTNGVSIKSLGTSVAPDVSIKEVQLLGGGRNPGWQQTRGGLARSLVMHVQNARWQQTRDALEISQPENLPNDFAIVYKMTLRTNLSVSRR